MPGRQDIIEDPSVCTATLKLVQSGSQNNSECMTQPPPSLISLRGSHFKIGRTLSSDAVIHSLQISRKHCVFEYKDSKWWIQDFSTNGIEINGQMLRKGIPGSLFNNDLIHLIPGGILSYRFDYKYHRSRSVSQEEPNGILPIPLLEPSADDDEGNASDESESLLSLGNGEDLFESAGSFDLNENDLQIIDSSDNPMRRDVKAAGHKRNFQVLGSKTHSASQKKNARGEMDSRRPNKVGAVCVTIEDEEDDEELLDLEDEPVVIKSPQRKILKTEPRETVLRSPIKMAAATSCSSSSQPAQDCVEMLDREVLSTQLKYFTDKCRDLANEKSLLILNAAMDKGDLKREIDRLKAEGDNQKSALYQNLASVLDTELNCCICNEIYIQATVIDCGHTFCNHCICEWRKKKSDCPVCRTVITKCSKQIELNNFLLKIHSLLPEELQGRRDQLLKDRATEVSVAQTVEAAEADELRQDRAGRGGAAGGQGAFNQLYLNQWEFDGINFGNLLGNWAEVNPLGGAAAGVALPRSVQVSRRSPRVRRGARVMVANTAVGTNLDAAIAEVAAGMPGRRGRRSGPRGRGGRVPVTRSGAPSAVSGAPDLITLDDSQTGGGLPAPLIPTPAPPVTRTRNNGGIMNSIWQSLLGPGTGE